MDCLECSAKTDEKNLFYQSEVMRRAPWANSVPEGGRMRIVWTLMKYLILLIHQKMWRTKMNQNSVNQY